MTLKGSDETKHRAGRDGTKHFTPCRGALQFLLHLCSPPFHPRPIVLPDILKNLPPLLSLSLSSLSSSFFNVLHDAFPRRMREKSERERWKRAGRGVEKENPGRLHRVVGLCLIKPGNETSMIRFPGARSVGRWVGFFRARFAAQTAFQPRIESNRIEKNHAGIKYERTRPYIKYAGTRGTRNFPSPDSPTHRQPFVSASARIIPLIIFSIYETLRKIAGGGGRGRARSREWCGTGDQSGNDAVYDGIVTRNTNSWSGNECFNNSLPRGPPAAPALSKFYFHRRTDVTSLSRGSDACIDRQMSLPRALSPSPSFSLFNLQSIVSS